MKSLVSGRFSYLQDSASFETIIDKFVQSIDTKESLHPSIVTTLEILAAIAMQRNQTDINLVKNILLLVLNQRKNILGPSHVMTITSQQASGTSLEGGPARETNHDATERKTRKKGRQRPSKDDRMLKGVDKVVKYIYVEHSEVHEEACEVVTIKNYVFIASYSWKDIEHPTIYVPGLSRLTQRKEV